MVCYIDPVRSILPALQWLPSSNRAASARTVEGSATAAQAKWIQLDLYMLHSLIQLGSVTHVQSSSEEATRESLLKAHLNKRIEELTLQFQQADSRSVSYHAECRALGRRLQISNKARTKAQDELTQANSTISHLQVSVV